jgi:muramidase (phage lysozyme)
MNRTLVVVGVVVAAVVAAAYVSANVGGSGAPADAPDDGAPAPGWADELTGAAASVNPFSMVNMNSATSDASDTNVQAWLATLRNTEGTDKAADPYAAVYGYAFTIADFSKHPADPKGQAWPGGLITRGTYAGKHSTAAGAYQFNWGTWSDAVRALGLPDFSPASQDAAAVWLTGKCGALDAVKAGDLASACAAASSRWASLPGSTAGQGGQALASVQETFTSNGGTLA